MALTTQQRDRIFTKLVPHLGEENAAALLDNLPGARPVVPASQDFVRAECAETRALFRTELADTRRRVEEVIRETCRGRSREVRSPDVTGG